jgi:hypothetical protein
MSIFSLSASRSLETHRVSV